MTQNLASDVRKPGTYHTFDDTSGARGLVPLNRAIACIGTLGSSGAMSAGVPTQVFNEADCDTQAGASTILSLMGKKVFAQARKLGVQPPKVFLVGVADPAGTAAIYKLTCAGTATEGKDVVFSVCGRIFRASVANGDDQDAVATAIAAALNARIKEIPFAAAVNGVGPEIVDLTATCTGVNSNGYTPTVISAPAGITVTPSAPTPGVGVIDDTAALDALLAAHYFSVAVENSTSVSRDDLEAHMDDAWAAGAKKYRHAFLCDRGNASSSTTLAAGANRKEVVIVGAENFQDIAGECAVAVGTARLSQERPSYNYDGTQLALVGPLLDSDVYIDTEAETLLAGGVTPLVRTDDGVEIMRLVTTKTTDSGAAFENLLDLSNSWTVAYYALQLDPRLKRALKGKNVDEDLLRQLEDIGYAVLKAGETLGDLHKVDDHKDEIVAASHSTVPSRILYDFPQSVVPNAHQVDATHRLFVEGA